MIGNILEYVERTAAEVPEKVAFSDGERALTFGALLAALQRGGSGLLSRGYGREGVAILMEKAPHAVAAMLGVVAAGCFYLPLDATAPVARTRRVCRTVGVRVILCDSAHIAAAEALRPALAEGGEVLLWEELCRHPVSQAALDEVRRAQVDTDPIYVVFTSGSTGVPKGVVGCHRAAIDYAEALCRALGFDRSTVFGNQSPLHLDAPLKEILPTLRCGATTYFLPRALFSSPVGLMQRLTDHGINTICWVPTALRVVASLGGLAAHPPTHLRTVCFGGEVLDRPTYDAWRAALPHTRFFNLYGPTEATGMACFWEADRGLAVGEPIPIGRPFPNTEVLLLSDRDRLAAMGEEGEICLGGSCLTLGYYGDPARTAAAYIPDPRGGAYMGRVYRTGDRARYNARGELVYVGRRDAMVKHLGHRIELGEIEAAAMATAGVVEAACVYDKDRCRLVLYYAGEAEGRAVSMSLRASLPQEMCTARCIRLPALPLTAGGKVDRQHLLGQLQQGASSHVRAMKGEDHGTTDRYTE